MMRSGMRLVKRATLMMLASVLVVAGLGTPAWAAPRFTDVPMSVQFYPEIQWLATEGISTGWQAPNGTATYRPVQAVTRDAMAAFIYRSSGSPEFTAPTQPSFRDVPVGTQFYKEIEWMKARGLSTGWDMGGGVFEYRPLAPIARDAMAAFLYRLAGSPSYSAEPWELFDDVTSKDQHFRAIGWMSVAGISTGWYENDKTLYRPLAPVNRDAMAAFLYRFNDYNHPLTGSKGSMPAGFAFADLTRLAPTIQPLSQCVPQRVFRYDGLEKATAWRMVEDGGVDDEGDEHYLSEAALVFATVADAQAYMASVREASEVCLAGGGNYGAIYGSRAVTTATGLDEVVSTDSAFHDDMMPWGTDSVVARRGRSVVHLFYTGMYYDYTPGIDPTDLNIARALLDKLPR